MKNQKVLPKDGFKKLLEQKSMMVNGDGVYGTLMDIVTIDNLCINKLYNGFISMRNDLKILKPQDFWKEYGVEDFAKDSAIFTYNGCWIEMVGGDSLTCRLEICRDDFKGSLIDCEMQLFMNWYMYEYCDIDQFLQDDFIDIGNDWSEQKDVIKVAFNEYIVEILDEYSGGGCHHYLLRLKNDIVVGYNLQDDYMYIAYHRWDSLETYFEGNESDRVPTPNGVEIPKGHIEDGAYGFGWEYAYPMMEERCFELKNYTRGGFKECCDAIIEELTRDNHKWGIDSSSICKEYVVPPSTPNSQNQEIINKYLQSELEKFVEWGNENGCWIEKNDIMGFVRMYLASLNKEKK